MTMYFTDQYGNVYYQPQEVDWNTIVMGMFGIGMLTVVASQFAGYMQEPSLDELRVKINKLAYVVKGARLRVVELRDHRTKLLKQYQIAGPVPALQEMRKKYPQLYHTQIYLTTREKDLDRMETRLTILKKQQKDIMIRRGIREEEPPSPRRGYTAMKKFQEPTSRE